MSYNEDLVSALRLQLAFYDGRNRRIVDPSVEAQELQLHFLQHRVHELEGALDKAADSNGALLNEFEKRYESVLLERGQLQKEVNRSTAVIVHVLEELRTLSQVHHELYSVQLACLVVCECYWRQQIQNEAMKYFVLRNIGSLDKPETPFNSAGDAFGEFEVTVEEVMKDFCLQDVPRVIDTQHALSDTAASATAAVSQMRPFAVQLRLAMKGVVIDDTFCDAYSALGKPPRVKSEGTQHNALEEQPVGVQWAPQETMPAPATPMSQTDDNKQRVEELEHEVRVLKEELAASRNDLAAERRAKKLLEDEKVRWFIERSELTSRTHAAASTPSEPRESAPAPQEQKTPTKVAFAAPAEPEPEPEEDALDSAINRLSSAKVELLAMEGNARSTPEPSMRRKLLREMDGMHAQITGSQSLAEARRLLAASKPPTVA